MEWDKDSKFVPAEEVADSDRVDSGTDLADFGFGSADLDYTGTGFAGTEIVEDGDDTLHQAGLESDRVMGERYWIPSSPSLSRAETTPRGRHSYSHHW